MPRKFKNKLNILLSVSGCDFIFDPQETKEFPEDSIYLRFLIGCPDLEEIKEAEPIIEPEKPAEPETEPVRNPFQCDLCEFVGKNRHSLRVHKFRKHNIPQK